MNSSFEWIEWVQEQTKETCETYLRQPDRLFGDLNREISYTNEYQGREVFELLQNANDAGAVEEKKSDVFITANEHGLLIANTGKPFDQPGVMSLMISDNSPKKKQRHKFIGNKGLGFRAVLNWSDCPFLISGDLALSFDRGFAEKQVSRLRKENSQLRKRIDELMNAGEKRFAPVLPFPRPLEIESSGPDWLGVSVCTLWQQAKEMRKDGYDTVIALPFKHPEILETVESELNGFRHEILFLTGYLNSLQIESPGTQRKWLIEHKNERVELIEANSDDTVFGWDLYQFSGTVPRDILQSDQIESPNYEIVIAVPDDLEGVPGTLFSYFPTQVSFPFPLVCHATLELRASRQHLLDHEVNGFVVKKIAEAMTVVAERCVTASDPWKAIQMLSTSKGIDLELERCGFAESLIDAAKGKEIIPVHGGQIVRSDEALLISASDASWLPNRAFDDVVVPPKERVLLQFMQQLDIPKLQDAALCERLNALSNHLSIPERASLIAGLIKCKCLPSNPTPTLLMGSDQEIISEGTRVFFPPSDSLHFDLPEWIKFRFLDDDLREALTDEFGVSEQRDLAHRLSEFQIVEYSLQSVVSALVAETNNRCRDVPNKEWDIRMSILHMIYEIYGKYDADERPRWPAKVEIQLPNRHGDFCSASALYMNGEFSGRGAIVEALYEKFAPEKIIAAIRKFDLPAGIESFSEFLLWVGVSEYPRDIKKKNAPDSFRDHVLQSIDYPAAFDNEIYDAPESVETPDIESVSSIDQLSEILANADPFAILAWLILDTRVPAWEWPSVEHLALRAWPCNARKYRKFSGRTPSYIKWLLSTSEWLPTDKEMNCAPRLCVMGTTRTGDLSRFFPRPREIKDHPLLERLSISRKRLANGFDRAGVNRTIGDMPSEHLFELLLDMPTSHPEGKGARALYKTIIESFDGEEPLDGLHAKEFQSDGMLWGRKGGNSGYLPVGELRYVDSDGIPAAFGRDIPLLDMQKRCGAKKVHQYFGVEPIDQQKLHTIIEDFSPSVEAHKVSQRFKRIKPEIYSLRLRSDADGQDYTKLRSLDISLCKSIDAIAEYDGVKVEFELKPWEWLLDGNVAYILEGKRRNFSSSSSQLLADAIGEILATAFRIERGGEFSRIIACPKEERVPLLEKMLGEDSPEVIKAVHEKWDEWATEENDDDIPSWSPVDEDDESEETSEPNDSDAGMSLENLDDLFDIDDDSSNPKPTGPVHIEPVEHVPDPKREKIKFRVKKTPKKRSSKPTGKRVADPDRCEKIAIEFEQTQEQNRFPVSVAENQGYESFGCDIISFSALEDHQNFINSSGKVIVGIERYIEVKGRSAEKGSIVLKGNELKAADRYAEKYYVYRIYEKDDGSLELAVLRDPLGDEEARDLQYEVDVFRSEETERFDLTVIEEKSSDN